MVRLSLLSLSLLHSLIQIIQPLACLTCDSAIVGVHSSLSPIRIFFPLTTSSRWKYPECVQLKKGTVIMMKISIEDLLHSQVIGNRKELFSSQSILPLLFVNFHQEKESSQLWAVNNKVNWWVKSTTIFFYPLHFQLRLSQLTPSYSLVLVGISIGLLFLSIFLTICRATIATKLIRYSIPWNYIDNRFNIRVGFCLSLLLEALVIFGMHKVVVNEVRFLTFFPIFSLKIISFIQIFCPVRNSLLSLSTSSPFAWLFLYSLHIYRLMSEGVNHCKWDSSSLLHPLHSSLLQCIRLSSNRSDFPLYLLIHYLLPFFLLFSSLVIMDLLDSSHSNYSLPHRKSLFPSLHPSSLSLSVILLLILYIHSPIRR